MDIIEDVDDLEFDLINYLNSEDDRISCYDEKLIDIENLYNQYTSKIYPDLLPTNDKEFKTDQLNSYLFFNLPDICVQKYPEVEGDKQNAELPEVIPSPERELDGCLSLEGSRPARASLPAQGPGRMAAKMRSPRSETMRSLLSAPRPHHLNRNTIMDPSHNEHVRGVSLLLMARTEDFAEVDGRVLLPREPNLLPSQPTVRDPRPHPLPDYRDRYVTNLHKQLSRVYSLSAPLRETQIDKKTISEEERELMPEFFRNESLASRYLKIRNHIVDCWVESRPGYVSKTSVRAGLKNCGDVNRISRVHLYLERKGVINFGCDLCHYVNERRKETDKAFELQPCGLREKRPGGLQMLHLRQLMAG